MPVPEEIGIGYHMTGKVPTMESELSFYLLSCSAPVPYPRYLESIIESMPEGPKTNYIALKTKLNNNLQLLHFLQKQMEQKLEERLNLMADKSQWKTDEALVSVLRSTLARVASLDFVIPDKTSKPVIIESSVDEDSRKMASQPPSTAPSPTGALTHSNGYFKEFREPDESARQRLSKRAGSSRQARRDRPASFKSPLHKRLLEGASNQTVPIPSLSQSPTRLSANRSSAIQAVEQALRDAKVSKAVFSYLDSKETLEARQVCKVWNGILTINSIASHAFTKSEKGIMYEVLRERETKFKVSEILSKQPQVNSHMRSILVDWIIDVCTSMDVFFSHEFRHTDDTLHLAVKLVDRLLQTVAVPRKELQLVGCAAILLAAKVEEVLSVRIDDLLYLCDHQYNRDELLQMETVLLEKLNYQFSCPTALSFIQWFWNNFTFSSKSHNLSHFFLELSLENVVLMQVWPSKLATASACLALYNDKQPYQLVLAVTGYSAEEISKLMNDIVAMCERQRNAWEVRPDKDADTLLQTTLEKFSAPEKDSVSKIRLSALV